MTRRGPTTKDALDALSQPRAAAVTGAPDDGTRHRFQDLAGVLISLQNAALSLGDRSHAIGVKTVIVGAHGATAVDAPVVPAS
jgi:hypothetical protein